jgi:recombinational DNA repair protein (RecF pathway)
MSQLTLLPEYQALPTTPKLTPADRIYAKASAIADTLQAQLAAEGLDPKLFLLKLKSIELLNYLEQFPPGHQQQFVMELMEKVLDRT